MRKSLFYTLLWGMSMIFSFNGYISVNGQTALSTQQQLEAQKAQMNQSNLQINFNSPIGSDGVLEGECDNALPITSGSITNQALVCGTENLLNSTTVGTYCNVDANSGDTISDSYSNGMEATYTYTPSTDGTATITVSNTSWTAIFVYEGCPVTGSCVASTRSTGTSRTLTFSVEEGVEYFFWIDTWPTPNSPCVEGGLLSFSGPEPMGGGGGEDPTGICNETDVNTVDNNFVTSVVTVSETGTVGTDATIDAVKVDIMHSWASDVELVLVSPSGTEVALTSDNGGSTGLDTQAILNFTDSSSNLITNWTSGAPLADYKAEGGDTAHPIGGTNGPGVNLNDVFAGESISGNWTLRIYDDASGDSGTVFSFCLELTAEGGGGGEGEDLIIIDLSTTNQVKITATSNNSAATASGSTFTGFIFENFFANTGEQSIGTVTYVGTPTLTAVSAPTDNSPDIFRSSNTDDGLNIWNYSSTSTTTFTTGSQAFTGEAIWNISPELYAAMLTAPESGNIYFPADSSDDIPSATLLGTYSVILPGGGGPDGGDNCGDFDPTVLTNGTPVTFNGTTVGATMSDEESTLLGWGAVWHAVTLTGDCNNLTIDYCGTPAGNMSTASIVYTPDCPATSYVIGSYDFVTCPDGNLTLRFTGLPAGTYYLPVVADAGLNPLGDYTMNVISEDCPAPPPNDDCEDAIAMACGDTNSGSTQGAINSGGNDSGDVFYSYTSTGAPEEVTVSLCGSAYDTYLRVFTDCTLTNEVAFNDDFCGLQSELSFVTDGTSTYYIMVEGWSTNTGEFTISVSCDEPFIVEEPDYPCFQGDGMNSNNFENGYNVTAGGTFRNADDFTVDNTFSLQYVRLNLFMIPGTTANSATFNIRADEGGAPSESNIVSTINATPTSQVVIGNNFGYDISQVEFILDTPVDFSAGTYWLQPEVNSDGGVVFWEVTTTGSNGGLVHTSESGGAWNQDPDGFQGVFFVAGVCDDTPPPVDCSQETPSNSFENGHGNLHMLKVANDFNVEINESFTVEQFKFNVILPAGATVDALDYYFYEDTGSGPGNEVDNTLFASPTSVEFVGNLSSFEVYTVTVDLDTPVVLNGSTSGDTAYWLGMMIYTGAANSYWEGTSVINTANEGYLELDGVWAPISTTFGSDPFDGVMEISGTCATLGVSDMTSFDFAYYPNPVKDILNITSDKNIENVSVFNLAGQQVMTSAKVNNGQINVTALPAGVYVFKATLQGGQVETFKIIKK